MPLCFKVIEMQTKTLFALLAILMFLSVPAFGENWPQWRGAGLSGVVSGAGYPTTWSEQENIVWKVTLPGWGTSSPVIWHQSIFVTCEVDQKNAIICLDRDGKENWKATFGPFVQSKNRKASGSNPSPVTDGVHVYAYFKSGDLACVDFDGKTIWSVNLQKKYGPDRLNWDLGTSPVLTKDFVVVAVMHQGPSYLVAFDKQTGKEVWKQDRDLGAPAESRDGYSTPLVIAANGREMLVVLGADHVTAHDAATGREVWRVGGLNQGQQRNFRSIASPVAVGDLIIAPYARGRTLTAIRLGGEGDVTKTHVAWTIDDASADVPTPVAYEGKVYVCGDRGEINCIDIQSGKALWTEELPRNRYPYSTSPLLADGKLYVTREDGTTFVLQLGEKPTLVGTNVLRENTYATPAFVDGQVFLRTSDFLFCLGKK